MPARNSVLNFFKDWRDIFPDVDSIWWATLVSKRLREGARHFSLTGEPLRTFKQVVAAFNQDGMVLIDVDNSPKEIGH